MTVPSQSPCASLQCFPSPFTGMSPFPAALFSSLPSPLPQPILRSGAASGQDPGVWQTWCHTTPSCLGHSSSSFLHLPNQVCLVLSTNPTFLQSCSSPHHFLPSGTQLWGCCGRPSWNCLRIDVSSSPCSCCSLTSFPTRILFAFPSLRLLHSVLLGLGKLQLGRSPVFHPSASIFTSQP